MAIDNNSVHDGRNSTYTFEKDGEKHTLIQIKDEGVVIEDNSKVLMVSGKKLLRHIINEEVIFYFIGNPRVILRSTKLTYFPVEI